MIHMSDENIRLEKHASLEIKGLKVMTKNTLIAAVTVLSIAVIAPLSATAHAQQSGATGQTGGMNQSEMMKKPGAGMGAGMGKGGMAKSGMGPAGMMNKHGNGGMARMMKMRKKMMGKMFMVRKKAYSNADIKRMIDGRLAKHGFSKLIAGDVVNGSDEMPKTAIVSVVSPKGELLFKVEVNRKNGMAAIIE